jgi:hypothetical protein
MYRMLWVQHVFDKKAVMIDVIIMILIVIINT